MTTELFSDSQVYIENRIIIRMKVGTELALSDLHISATEISAPESCQLDFNHNKVLLYYKAHCQHLPLHIVFPTLILLTTPNFSPFLIGLLVSWYHKMYK